MRTQLRGLADESGSRRSGGWILCVVAVTEFGLSAPCELGMREGAAENVTAV